jgi:hypothetical protein
MRIFSFVIQSKVASENATINVRMRVGRTVDFKMSTYLTVPISKWDKKTGSVKNAKTSELKELVVSLSDITHRLNEAYLNHSRSGGEFTREWLQSVIHPKKK